MHIKRGPGVHAVVDQDEIFPGPHHQEPELAESRILRTGENLMGAAVLVGLDVGGGQEEGSDLRLRHLRIELTMHVSGPVDLQRDAARARSGDGEISIEKNDRRTERQKQEGEG